MRLGLFVGLRPLGLGTLGKVREKESLPAFHSIFCFQRVSLAPQVGPVVMAKRHRSSVVPHNAVSRDPSMSWAGMGGMGFSQCQKVMLQPSVLWMLWGQCSAVCSGCLCPLACITLVPVGTAPLAMLDHCPEACIPPEPMVAASLAVQDHRDGDQVDQRSCGRCWRTVGLQSHILLVSHFDR